MKFPSPSEIKQMRLSLGLTQVELARLSGISQSTITKIERGTIKGSYESVAAIFTVLFDLLERRNKGRKAREVASREVICITADDRVKKASDTMREKGFSQLPVMMDGRHVGSISDRILLKLVREGESMEELGERKVEEIMGDVFPVVSEETPLEAITSLLAFSDAVLVAKKGEIRGIITSSDVLKLI